MRGPDWSDREAEILAFVLVAAAAAIVLAAVCLVFAALIVKVHG